MAHAGPVLESALVVLSGVTLSVQVAGWYWVRKLHRAMRAGDGYRLLGIIAFLLGWTVVLRIIGFFSLLYFAASDSTEEVVLISLLTQIAFLFIVFVVWRRLRGFSTS